MKARVETAYGEWVERIPAWAKWATQVWAHLQRGHHTYPLFFTLSHMKGVKSRAIFMPLRR